ncbi:MAG: DUF1385 domain-containing protein [Oscillospiraceae bacterium]|nr:DUF1385 domain-containing protein [Oscillospiraceae bacterium]
MSKKDSSCAFRTSIGGQALIEGILMRGPDKQAIVCRKANGELSVKESELKLIKDKHPILGWPFVRGVVTFLDSLVKGMQAVTWSAEQQPEEMQEEPGKFDLWLEKKLGSEKAEKIVFGIAIFLGIALAVGLFFFLPTLLTGLMDGFLKSRLLRNLVEGVLRIVIFLLYLWAVTHMKDIRRMFSYHGAEHKTIHCYERGLELTVENVRTMPKEHPRCGTSFLFVVMIVSIFVLMFVTWTTPLLRLLIRLCLLPVIVAISYEINRWVGRHDNVLSTVLAWPGRQLQHLTTYEPDDGMIECAIEALKHVIPEETGKDEW